MRPIDVNVGDKHINLRITGGRCEKPIMLEKDGTVRVRGEFNTNVTDGILPQECRIRNLTYSGPFYVDVHVERSDQADTIIPDVFIGNIPIMVFSSLCHLNNADPVKHGECDMDPGGYFIVNGGEKSIVPQKNAMHNRLITYERNGVTSCAVKSERNRRIHVTTLSFKDNCSIMCTFNRLEEEIPIMCLLIAMGFDVESMRSVFSTEENNILAPSFRNLPPTRDEARRRIRIREVYNVGLSEDERLDNALSYVFIPHISPEDKPVYIISMIQELLAVYTGKIKRTDRDSVANQRVDTCCTLLSNLFLQLMIKLSTDIKLLCQKSLPKLKKGITDEKIRNWFSKSNTLTDGLSYSLATGNWNTTYVDRATRAGVSQSLQRLTYISTISQLRRVSSSVEKTTKIPSSRWLHGTHHGNYCNSETPEGASCGLENQKTLQTYISLGRNPSVVIDVIKQYLEPKNVENLKHPQVFVNGIYEGSTKTPKRLVETFLFTRRTGQIEKDMSISYKQERNHIHISTTSGRMCRPLLIVKNGRCVYENTKDADKMSFNQLCSEGVIEYLDAEETDTTLIGFFVKDLTSSHTHCEISNDLMNGLCASTIPFSDHNPGVRNSYQCAMAKQASGTNAANFQHRMDTTSHNMWYGQKPLATTNLASEYGVHDLPTGINAIVAIMPYEGLNQEDSIIVNESAVDRGFGRCDTYRTMRDSLSGKEDSAFKKPIKKRRVGKYNALEEDGMLRPGIVVKPGDCVIGKVSGEDDNSKMATVNGTIDKVMIYQERNGDRACKVRIRQHRVPTVGDKFSSRHGQKGTIGMKYTQEDMPYCPFTGMVPDIIVNPHAIPSRMTIGHLVECLSSKSAAINGTISDASPFTGRTVEDMMQELHDAGFNRKGTQTLISGISGKPIKAMIFFGPTFYQKLKHMVGDKIHSRGRGRMNELTHQPNDGRSNGGGLRVGEMEKDSFNSHGVPWVINERMCTSSDAHEMVIKGKKVIVPYAAKLLFEELQSMCINVDLQVK